ncbi:MAG: anthranilate synthase component I [Planctomycetota bacterium]
MNPRLEPAPDLFRRLLRESPDAGTAAGSSPAAVRRVPVFRRLFADALTPVLAYRRLVRPDQRAAPSFLFESVYEGERAGRYSFVGARPSAEVWAYRHQVTYTDHDRPEHSFDAHRDDPLAEMRRLSEGWSCAAVPGLPGFTGGWVGYAGYDTVRYLEPEKLAEPPDDDRGLPDLHFQLYRDLVVFDHAQKTALVVSHAELHPPGSDAGPTDPDHAFAQAADRVQTLCDLLFDPEAWPPQDSPADHVDLATPPPTLPTSNLGPGGFPRAVEACKRYIAAGDAFQIVPSQRFDLPTQADPFDVYRALRVVNPSPYMFYLQAKGSILVGSSPEVLCRVIEGEATSRPLAGTRKRGASPQQDRALEDELRASDKDRAEHVMLVDLHRNDIGRVAKPGSVRLTEVLTVERYSHVMHLSSEVRGMLAEGWDAWDALRVSLPVGTVSGAPKVRAMQIIDELEAARRGPYGGAVGYADFHGNLDMCIALRTIVFRSGQDAGDAAQGQRWVAHLQAGGGIVADSDPQEEHQETVNKAAALAKAIALAEQAFA